MGSFVAEAQAAIADQVSLPSGRYRLEYGGQFEHLQRARARLLIVVPLALVLIFGLLYLTYRNVVDALRVFTGVPFAWVGGIFALWLRDMPFSISAGVGFIAMSRRGRARRHDPGLLHPSASSEGTGAGRSRHASGRSRACGRC